MLLRVFIYDSRPSLIAPTIANFSIQVKNFGNDTMEAAIQLGFDSKYYFNFRCIWCQKLQEVRTIKKSIDGSQTIAHLKQIGFFLGFYCSDVS
ncbi:hypothetical protein L1887_28945 [Cichorium endivia]|nr:hypothetical protein L1887_28945 [Cichorium endivia]